MITLKNIEMILVIGLGNPGEQYKSTRHNVGFMAIDEFARKNNFPEFKLQKKSNALMSENENMLLAKPQTFMNDSGRAVKSLLGQKKAESLIIIHDDIDLPIGKIKIIKDRGSAGHKGVESIIKSIGNNGLIRIRIGIAPQNDIKAKKIVLKNFSKDEQEQITDAIKKASSALDLLLKEGLEKAMSQFNQ